MALITEIEAELADMLGAALLAAGRLVERTRAVGPVALGGNTRSTGDLGESSAIHLDQALARSEKGGMGGNAVTEAAVRVTRYHSSFPPVPADRQGLH